MGHWVDRWADGRQMEQMSVMEKQKWKTGQKLVSKEIGGWTVT